MKSRDESACVTRLMREEKISDWSRRWSTPTFFVFLSVPDREGFGYK